MDPQIIRQLRRTHTDRVLAESIPLKVLTAPTVTIPFLTKRIGTRVASSKLVATTTILEVNIP
jgi:hypothetical protein